VVRTALQEAALVTTEAMIAEKARPAPAGHAPDDADIDL
jgi:hypothetical protein